MLNAVATTTCFIVGNGALALQCAQTLLERGHRILGVATHDDQVVSWASARGIDTRSDSVHLVDWMAAQPFDYLFSIVNLSLLPDALIQLPAQQAFNFHDGPLPRFAGLNTPSWALIDGATEYGVTWHEMTAGADRGRIAAQRLFPVDADETALSLNAKCFDAGITTFAELADQIDAGNVTLKAQDEAARTYFSKYQRPAAASAIQFDAPADRVCQFIAAHQFGAGYPNPFASAKLVLDTHTLIVGHATQQSAASTLAPGTVVSIETTAAGDLAATIATATNDVRLSGLVCLAGVPLATDSAAQFGLHVGAVAVTLADDVQTNIDQATRDEAECVRKLTQTPLLESRLEAPNNAAPDNAADATITVEVPALNGTEDLTHTALAVRALALLGKLTKTPQVVAIRTALGDSNAQRTHGVVAARALVNVALDPDAPLSTALSTLAEQITESTSASGRGSVYLRDMLVRHPELAATPRDASGAICPLEIRLGAGLGEPIGSGCALAIEVDNGRCTLRFDPAHIAADAVHSLLPRFNTFVAQSMQTNCTLATVCLVTDDERKQVLDAWNNTAAPFDAEATIHGMFSDQAARTPDAPAVTFRGLTLSFAELDARSNQLARHLRTQGVEPQQRVGLSMQRSVDMVVGALAILKAGAAYVPLDPAYPRERLALMIEDATLRTIVAHKQTRLALIGSASSETSADNAPAAHIVCIDRDAEPIAAHADGTVISGATARDLAYVIYTSGSTGRPKGVMVEHRNVANFFVGMDQRLEHDRAAAAPGAWLALTSMNFDISVLELFWTLTRGLHVVVHADEGAKDTLENAKRGIEFGLFYFSSDESEGLADKYQLLLDGARFADTHGFNSVWTPERHFHAFGGLFPNPSVTSAALATITQNVHLRAGSCVTPLHSPIRVAEEWSVVDNLSKGRVGISVAAGWQPNDFVIRPDRWEGRRERMFEEIELLRALWRGDSATFPNGVGDPVEVRILPRPYSTELPIWVTAAGNPETFREAGAAGANLLTHLLGQSLPELAEKIAIYRKARADAGYEGRGIVSLMLHTFIGTSNHESREIVREPMKNYLRSAVGLVKAAAWSFPTFKKTTTMDDGSFGIDHLADEEMDALLNHAFERYYDNAGLFGDMQTASKIVDGIKGIDVDEIPCLIDFGIPTETVLEALPRLAEVLRRANEHAHTTPTDGDAAAPEADYDIAAQSQRHGVTHLQCTPSQMALLTAQQPVRDALSRMNHVLVGGEALPAPLARDLASLVPGTVHNMYGPTETTIWSSSSVVTADAPVTIGTPIANTHIVIVDEHARMVPPGRIGELCIGGAGVVRGYLERPELTAERFIRDTFAPGTGADANSDHRLYRTGDLARFDDDGVLHFRGRVDHQVKLRGYRIELGEIEARLAELPAVSAAAVIVREDIPGDQRLVAYVVSTPGAPADPDTLRDTLSAQLPDYMVPSAFVYLPRFPETPNRKVDRRALPAPERKAAATASFVEPTSGLQAKIAAIWTEVLGLPSVGSHDNFFDLGGHSLLTIQVHALIKEQVERPVSLVDLFRFPTIAALAGYLEGDDGSQVLEETRERAVGRKAAMARRRAARGSRK